jgi:glucose-1-phosphate cytidylyltransferase
MPARRSTPARDQFGECKVIILAGGFGTRLAEHTDDLPKPMVHIGDRPILWHILKIYSHFGFNDFLIACGYKSQMIKRFFLEYRDQMSNLLLDFASGAITRIDNRTEPWRVATIDTGEHTLTGGRIRRMRPYLDGRTFMMTYGDGVADVDLRALLAFHRSHGKLASFTAVPRPSQFGVPTLEGDRVVRFAEKPTATSDLISGGFFVLEPAVMDYIDGDQSNFEFHVLSRLAADGQLMAYRHRGFWHPMDTLRDVRKLNAIWADDHAPWKVWDQPPARTRRRNTRGPRPARNAGSTKPRRKTRKGIR